MEGFGAFGAFAGWQTAALKANRKPLLWPGGLFGKWPWPWGPCWGRWLEGLEGLEGFRMFGAFAGWQTVALKAHRKLCCGLGPGVPVGEVALALGCLLGRVFGGFGGFWRVWRVLEGVWRVWKVLEGLEGFGGCLEGLEGFGGFGGFWRVSWPWGACSGSGLGPGVPAGDGGWRVVRVLEGLEGLEGFGMFGAFVGWQTVALKAHRKLCCGLGPGVPVGEVALALGCLLGRVFGGFGGFWRVWRVLEGVWRVWRVLEGLEGFGAFGAFAGWQTAALKANRKPLLWPWPWGACLRSGLGPGVPVGEGVWRVWRVLEGGVWRVWKVLEGLEGLEGFGGCLEGLEGFGGFGGFWSVWSVCGLANGSFESQ